LSTESGKLTGIKFPPTASLSCFHAAFDGHAASAGRRLMNFAAVVAVESPRGRIGRSAADPIAFRNDLLFPMVRLPIPREAFNSINSLGSHKVQKQRLRGSRASGVPIIYPNEIHANCAAIFIDSAEPPLRVMQSLGCATVAG
jgi:hypothetical protein